MDPVHDHESTGIPQMAGLRIGQMEKAQTTEKRERQRGRWRALVRLNVGISVVLSLLLVLLLNLLSAQYYFRSDISAQHLYRLSPQTESLLQELTEPVDVIVFFERGEALFHDIDNLLREYQYRAPMLRVEYVDPDRNIGRAEELARRFGVEQPNVVIFHHDGRSRELTATDIMELDFTHVRERRGPARARFRGEQAFSSAIHFITQTALPSVYFLSGHGQRRIDNFDRFVGYSDIAHRMRVNNIELETLLLSEAHGIPEDAAALVIAGPTRRLSQPELDLINDYLERSGRVMLLLDSMTRTGLEPLLRRWGVVLGDDVIMDPGRSLTGREIFVTDYGLHPITAGVRGLTTVFYNPRSVLPVNETERPAADQADKPHVSVLAQSSAASWAETNPDQVPVRFDPGIDRPGPIPLAVAVERGPVPGIDVQIRSTRLVVFGDSGFVSNAALTGGDEDLFMRSLNWLLDRDELMTIASREIDELRLVLSQQQQRWLHLWVLGALPGAVALCGLLVWSRRRGKS